MVAPVDRQVTHEGDGASRDLTRLAHELQQLQEFLDGMPDAMLDIELASNRVTAINRMTTIVLGYTPEDVASGLSATTLATPAETARLAEISRGFIVRGLAAGNGRYQRSEAYNTFEVELLRRDRSVLDAEIQASYILNRHQRPVTMRVVIRDISERKAEARARQQLVEELQAALAEVHALRGLIPICAWCHSIRDDQGYWQRLEAFLSERADVEFTHGICEPCAANFEAAGPREASV